MSTFCPLLPPCNSDRHLRPHPSSFSSDQSSYSSPASSALHCSEQDNYKCFPEMNFVSFEQMVQTLRGREGKTNKQKEVTNVDFSSLLWERPGCVLKDQHEIQQKLNLERFWLSPQQILGHFEGDLRDWPQFWDLPWGAGEKASRCKIHFVQSWLKLLLRLNGRQHELSTAWLACFSK